MLWVLVGLYIACAGPARACEVREVEVRSGMEAECKAVLKRQKGFKLGCVWRQRGNA